MDQGRNRNRRQGAKISTDEGDQLLEQVIRDPDSGAAYKLVKEIFGGYPIETLRRLLSNEDERIQGAGVFALSELGVQASPLIDEAVPFLAHPDARVRHDAMDCILVCAGKHNGTAVVAVLPLLSDPHSYIRARAMWFLMNLSDDALRGGLAALQQKSRNDEHVRGWEMLLNLSHLTLDDLLPLLKSDNALTRRYAAAALARIGFRGRKLLNVMASQIEDEDIRKFVNSLPTTISWGTTASIEEDG